MDLVAFDVDGTLVDSSGINGGLYREAGETELGIQVDDAWSRYIRLTDSGVLKEIMFEDGTGTVLSRESTPGPGE